MCSWHEDRIRLPSDEIVCVRHFAEVREQASPFQFVGEDATVDEIPGKLDHAANVAHVFVASALGVVGGFSDNHIFRRCVMSLPVRMPGGFFFSQAQAKKGSFCEG